MRKPVNYLAAAAFAAAVIGPAAVTSAPIQIEHNGTALVMLVSGGCGPNGWRGQLGHCRFRHIDDGSAFGVYVGHGYRYPAGPFWNRSCPPRLWRGPWGHCRDTSYHGNLPEGGFKP